MTNKKIELVELNEIPKQVGTRFILILQVADDVNAIHSFNCTLQLDGDIHYYSDDALVWKHICLNYLKVIKILALPHAELRAIYRENGAIPEDFEYLQQLNNDWRVCEREPSWLLDVKYRYNPRPKQKHILINNEIVPEPIKHELEVGERYYFVDLNNLNTDFHYWNNDLCDKSLLEAGCIHKTRDNAKIHLDALIKANKQEGLYLND